MKTTGRVRAKDERIEESLCASAYDRILANSKDERKAKMLLFASNTTLDTPTLITPLTKIKYLWVAEKTLTHSHFESSFVSSMVGELQSF